MIFSRQNDKRSHVCSVLLLVNVILGLEYKAPITLLKSTPLAYKIPFSINFEYTY